MNRIGHRLGMRRTDCPTRRVQAGEIPRIFHQALGLGDLIYCSIVGNLSLVPVYTCAYNKVI